MAGHAALFMFTPALLIYGIGGDDVISYALWTVTLGLAYLGIRQKRFWLMAAANIALIGAMAAQYSSIVLLPAMYAIPSDVKVRETFSYVWRFRYWILSTIATIAVFWLGVFYITGFSYSNDFLGVFAWARDQTFTAQLEQHQYVFAFSERLICVFDFVLLAGPASLFPPFEGLRNIRRQPLEWNLRNVALTVLLSYVALQSLGAGETARGWGGLYVVLLFGGVACFYADLAVETQRKVMRYSLCWALVLQSVINFGW